MKRRDFLIAGTLLGISPYTEADAKTVAIDNSLKSVKKTIEAVQEHLFPKGSKVPSAKSMNAIKFLMETVSHTTYDKDIRKFVIEGARELESRTKGSFASLSEAEKEKALRSYEDSGYGSSWISRIMILTMEGVFSDPVYGSNIKEAGWKALHSFGGEPRPKRKYMEL